MAFLHQDAILTPYSAKVLTDFTVPPGNVAMAIDELAQRVTDNLPNESHITLIALAVEHAFS